jgi:hypothetical protein
MWKYKMISELLNILHIYNIYIIIFSSSTWFYLTKSTIFTLVYCTIISNKSDSEMFITEQKSKARQNGAWCLQNPSSKEQLGSTYN